MIFLKLLLSKGPGVELFVASMVYGHSYKLSLLTIFLMNIECCWGKD